MTQKLIITKPGFDAGTTTNPNNLIFSSDYNTLKYDISGTTLISITGNGSTQNSQIVVSHNLGYVPFYACFVNSGVGGAPYFPIPRTEQTAAPNSTIYASAFVDGTNLYLTLQTNYGVGTVASAYYAYKVFKNNTGL